MEYGGDLRDAYELPENDDDGFDERALELAIRENRERQFEALAQLNSLFGPRWVLLPLCRWPRSGLHAPLSGVIPLPLMASSLDIPSLLGPPLCRVPLRLAD